MVRSRVAVVEPPCPPCSREDLRCLTARLLWWLEASCSGSRLRPLDVLIFAAARWCAARGLGCSEMFGRISGAYAEADRVERLHQR